MVRRIKISIRNWQKKVQFHVDALKHLNSFKNLKNAKKVKRLKSVLTSVTLNAVLESRELQIKLQKLSQEITEIKRH